MLRERNYSFKKSRKFWVERNSSWLLDDRVWRSKDYVTIKKMGYKFIYIDESGANKNLYPSSGYSKINVPYIVTTG